MICDLSWWLGSTLIQSGLFGFFFMWFVVQCSLIQSSSSSIQSGLFGFFFMWFVVRRFLFLIFVCGGI